MRKTLALLLILCFMCTGCPMATAQEAGQRISSAGAQSVADPDLISLDIKGMDIVEVLKMLSAKGNLNIVIGNDVRGRVTIFLKGVNIMDAFEIILIANDLAYDKRGDIIYVMTQRNYEALYGERFADKKVVRIYQLKYAKAAEVSKALNQIKTKVGRVIVDDGSNTVVVIDTPAVIDQIDAMMIKIDLPTMTKIFELRYAKAADIKTKVSEMLTKGVGTVQIDERTNKVAVTDLNNKMPEIERVMAEFDTPLLQVLIESKIVSITLSDEYKLGVDWEGVLNKLAKEISIKSAFQITAANALVPGGQIIVGSLTSPGDYAVMIQALKKIGDTNLLSSPRITALNNQEAKILVGTSQPYATNTVTQGTSTTTTATNLTFIDVGVKLYVTPTINKDGYVTMKIKPEVSAVDGTYTYGTPETKVPIVSTTQAETSVTVKDGTTIIIAGLIKDERMSVVEKLPLLGDIPIIGEAFKRTVDSVTKQELVVFITPHIITGGEDYIEQPMSKPIGDNMFTMQEKPTFERRDEVKMDPTIYKEKKRPVWWETKKSLREDEPAMTEKKAGQTVYASTLEEYYYMVKNRIIENVRLPKSTKKSSFKGKVKVAFGLMPDGQLTYGPIVLESSNKVLDDTSLEAVKSSAPFSTFPEFMGQGEKRFTIDIVFD